jgi:hypothetical protein
MILNRRHPDNDPFTTQRKTQGFRVRPHIKPLHHVAKVQDNAPLGLYNHRQNPPVPCQ